MAGNNTRNTGAIIMGEYDIRVGPCEPHVDQDIPVLNAGNSVGKQTETTLHVERDVHDIVSGFPENYDGAIPLREDLKFAFSAHEFTAFNLALSLGRNPFAATPASARVLTKKSTSGITREPATIETGVEGSGWNTLTETHLVTFTDATHFSVFGAISGHLGDGTVGSKFDAMDGAVKRFTLPAGFFSGTWAEDDSLTLRTVGGYAAGDAFGSNPFSARFKLGDPTPSAYLRVEASYIFPARNCRLTVIAPRAQIKSNLSLSMGKEEAKNPMEIKAAKATSEVVGGHSTWDDSPIGCIVLEAL